jgi:hypothetical protein
MNRNATCNFMEGEALHRIRTGYTPDTHRRHTADTRLTFLGVFGVTPYPLWTYGGKVPQQVRLEF